MVRGYGAVCLAPGCEPPDILWITVDPTAGSTPGHGTFSVDVTFDSTGMAPGTYTATLSVESNDPDEPVVLVPLTMTVLAPSNIEVTPLSLSQELCPEATVTQQLTICNSGDLPLSWELIEMPCQGEALTPPSRVPASVESAGRESAAPITAAAPARPPGKVEPATNPEWPLWISR